MKSRAIHIIFFLVGIIYIGGNSIAGGCCSPEARRKLPNIPTQRALLQYRNGIETLIIESSLDSEKSNTGWIIPLPNQPLEFDTMSPGLLKTLSLQMQPIIHNEKRFGNMADIYRDTIVTVLILVLCFIFMRWGIKGGILPASLFVLFTILYPRFMVDRQADYRVESESSIIVESFVKIKGREVVGNYEIFVLKARNSTELNSWLDSNGLNTFQPEATKLIDHYIAQHGYFAVAKPKTKSDGLATPQAVLLKFETDRPVYPMQLMALADSSVFLELFVVGEHEAVPISFDIKKEYCNFFDYKKFSATGVSSEPVDRKGFVPRKVFEHDREIAHSDASRVMWNGCVVTKFADTVPGSAMRADMFFNFKKAVPYRKQLYSSKAKFDKVYSDTLSVAAIGAILLAIFYRITRKRWTKLSIAGNWLLLFISCAAAFAYAYISLGETTEVYTVERSSGSGLEVLLPLYFSYPNDDTISSGEELIALLNRQGINNPITNEPIILEDSPGNVICERSSDDIKIKYCNINGSLDTLPQDLPILSRAGVEPNILEKQHNYLLSQ
jgi:hypothetical protein